MAAMDDYASDGEEEFVYDEDDEEEYVYEEDEDDEAGVSGSAPSFPLLVRQASVTISDSDAVKRDMDKFVANSAEVLCIPEDDALLLLQYFKWDDQKLQGLFYDKTDEIRKGAGLTAGKDPPSPPTGVPCLAECPWTMDDDVAWSECDSMPCGHWMSKDGWREFLREAANHGPGVAYLECFASGCTERVRPRMFRSYLEPGQLEKYQHFLVESFVSANASTQWCPAPGCGLLAMYSGGGAKDVACKCGHEFCFACLREAHRPADCEAAKAWEEKNSSESENTTWIIANTKPCPKCGVSIEKNQGCNHMTCRKAMGGCGHDFCWMCLGDWSAHGSSTGGYYTCNKYKKMKEEGALDKIYSKQDKARVVLDRYLHYFSRFDNHDKARRHAKQLLVRLEKKMDQLQSEKGLTYKDVECLRTAVEAILKGRRVLKWSYVFAFFCTDSQELALFEFLQQQLETNNEHLLELLELSKVVDKYLGGSSPEEYRVELFDYLRSVRNYVSISMKFMEDVLRGVENGLTEPGGAGAAAAAEGK